MNLSDLICSQASSFPDTPAILAPGREPLTYGSLHHQQDQIVSQLSGMGVGLSDRVAIALPDGPEMAVAFLSILSFTTCAPLNPGLRRHEYDFYLSEIRPRALILEQGKTHPAGEVARSLGISVLELKRDENAEAGVFSLAPLESRLTAPSPVVSITPQADDVALILHTSGTTGHPKMVPLSHGNICTSILQIKNSLELTSNDRCLNIMPLFHIHGLIAGILASLAAGGSVVCPPGFIVSDFLDWVNAFRPSWYTAVPAMHHSILNRVESTHRSKIPNSLRFIRSSSSAIPQSIAERLENILGVPVIEAYGMTEAAHQVCSNPLPPKKRKKGSVGVIETTKVEVMNPEGTFLPRGRTGEIVIRGENLMSGYLNDSLANSETFSEGWFRTGDLGYIDEEGYLFLTSRIKEVINRGGETISPIEVEDALLKHPAVKEAVVFPMPDERLGEEVAAAVVTDDGCEITPNSVMEFVSHILSDSKIPRRIVLLEKIPKSSTGKPMRIGLAEKLGINEIQDNKFAPFIDPRTDLEKELIRIWKNVLRIGRIGIHDNFFGLGGDSILATQIISRVQSELGQQISFVALFQNPTVAGLAENLCHQTSSANETKRLAQDPRFATIPRNDGQEKAPLSFSQEGIWLLTKLNPNNPFYNKPFAFHLRGKLNRETLREALSILVTCHEVLRTVYRDGEDGLEQVILPPSKLRVEKVDPRNGTIPLQDTEIQELVFEESRQPFDLANDLMLRAKLIQIQNDDHVLILTTHHIASDGWSDEILLRELSELYSAIATRTGSSIQDNPIRYLDYAVWQRKLMEEEKITEQLSYWKNKLAGCPALLQLPVDRPRPPKQNYLGGKERFAVPKDLSDALRTFCQKEKTTVFVMMLSVFQALLYLYSGSEDIVVGSPFANRTRVETENLIGFFMNNLVLRTDFSGNPTFWEVLTRVHQVVLEAFANHEVPFEQVVDALHVERNLSHAPLFQVMFNFENMLPGFFGLNGLQVQEIDVDTGTSKYDLTLSLKEVEGKIEGAFEYNSELFNRTSICRMGQHLIVLLQSVMGNLDVPVSALKILTTEEERQLLIEWNDTKTERPTECIHKCFEFQAMKTPNATAVVFEDEEITYRELNRRSNQMAHYLRSIGVGTETLVGVYMGRSIDMVISLLGILKAGGAYVPLDPTYPEDRIAFMIQDASIPILLTQSSLALDVNKFLSKSIYIDKEWEAISQKSGKNPNVDVNSGHLAYVIYTSGSTGKPKGVMIEHRNVANFFVGMDEQIPTTGGDASPGTWLAATSLSFDISVLEIFWTLSRGFKIVLYSDRVGTKRASHFKTSSSNEAIDFSLFYFASEENEEGVSDKYRLLLEGAKFADENHFSAVWVPERHFHEFGGLYPNPSVAGAAIATITENVQIRAGSCVIPLHNPIRVAEEWSFVDNLSKGRVGIAVASGWQPNDFVLFPDNYADRREIMYQNVEIIQKLWKGDTISVKGPTGKEIQVQTLPRPVQKKLPVWVTARSPESFRIAGEKGFNLLTHLLGLTPDQLAKDLEVYRKAWRANGHSGEGKVTLMLHTFVGDNIDSVREIVREPMKRYLNSSMGLVASAAESFALIQERAAVSGRRSRELLEAGELSEEDKNALLDHAFEQYFSISGLFGTQESCLDMVEKLREIGVNEIACLIDFGVPSETVLSHLKYLEKLKEYAKSQISEDNSIAALMKRHEVTHFQCTPSMAKILLTDRSHRDALKRLQTMMLGGESLPISLARELKETISGSLFNMYGPTETTIWSTVYPVGQMNGEMSIGRPISNTEIYILNKEFQPVPVGIVGEIYIGGAGVGRGYLGREELTAERFIPDPFSPEPDSRLYRTGDLGRYMPDGNIEFLGRSDFQVKIRGHRIELGEIEALLDQYSGVQSSVVVVQGDDPDRRHLAAFIIPVPEQALSIDELRDFLKDRLPDYMIPSHFAFLEKFPLTANGKIDRRALPICETRHVDWDKKFIAPRNDMELGLAEFWEEVLGIEQIGVHDNFFEIGGNSLLAVRMVAMMEQQLGLKVGLTTIFEAPTIEEMAARLMNDWGRTNS